MVKTPTTPPLPSGTLLFQLWLADESSKPFQSLNPEPQGVYEDIWNAWLKCLSPSGGDGDDADWLASAVLQRHGLPTPRQWHEAQGEDVARFVRMRAGQRAGHQPERQLSEVTRRRYWRVLDRVYTFAVQQGWLRSNPVLQLHWAERPRAVDQLGHCLSPALWARLPAHFPASDCLQGARDRAILLLLYELALAPEEVRTLQDDSLLDAKGGPLAATSAAVPVLLQLDGARKAQHRQLDVPAAVGAALAQWLQFRRAHDATLSGHLFHSRKGGALSIRALFHVAAKVIHEAHAALPEGVQKWPLQRVGPQVMRNTAIVTWLRAGLSEIEVIRRIGVEDHRALGHLQHQLSASAPDALSELD